MRSASMRRCSWNLAQSSGVRFPVFFRFFAIVVLQQHPNASDVCLNVTHQADDSGDVSVGDGRLHGAILAAKRRVRKMSETDSAPTAFLS